jgi:hypothetical protein
MILLEYALLLPTTRASLLPKRTLRKGGRCSCESATPPDREAEGRGRYTPSARERPEGISVNIRKQKFCRTHVAGENRPSQPTLRLGLDPSVPLLAQRGVGRQRSRDEEVCHPRHRKLPRVGGVGEGVLGGVHRMSSVTCHGERLKDVQR